MAKVISASYCPDCEVRSAHASIAGVLIGSPMAGVSQRQISLTGSQWHVLSPSSIIHTNYQALKMIDFTVACLKGHTVGGSRWHRAPVAGVG